MSVDGKGLLVIISAPSGAGKDASIERRFRRYGPFAGLAFWLFVTRDWVKG